MTGVLQRHSHFIGNPHGTIDNASTWIFTQPALQKLLEDPGYRQFVNACLISRTVIFAGVTADDTAIETHLEALNRTAVKGVTHYWITNRADANTDRWSENLNIRIIRYNAPNGDHQELLDCLRGLANATPAKDEKLTDPVIFSAATPEKSILPPDELMQQPLEVLRKQLNGHVAQLLCNPDGEAYARYQDFEREYDETIDRAWYVGTSPPKNVILGYTLYNKVAQGSFGDVYEAKAPNGSRVAVKLLRRDVRREPAMLQTFRRGVRSMKILKDREVPGMINFIDASEIPAFVVMEWIDGPNLAEAVAAKELESWEKILQVAKDLASIVHAAHKLPEFVLHRDIRPPNVMLRNYWATREIEVIVMDFDLSWHVDALEKSIVAKPLGFMAPEQLHGKGGMTRSALVDSFGFGMTLYYILTKEIPVPDQQKHKDWETTLTYKIRGRICKAWRSLPARIMRLVLDCTLDRQSERPDFSRITTELSSLQLALLGNISGISADYYCEEVAANAATMENYQWDSDNYIAKYQSGGLSVTLEADIPRGEINLIMKWQQTGEENWKLWPKTSAQVSERAKPTLERTGWSKAGFDASYGQMVISAKVQLEINGFNPQQLAKGIDTVVAAMLPKA